MARSDPGRGGGVSTRLAAAAALLLMMMGISGPAPCAAGEPGETWPGFRGETRDGRAAWLPGKWRSPTLLWSHPLPQPGVGGVAADDSFVIVSGRDAADTSDLFVCLDPVTGTPLWQFSYPAAHHLDYGNSPRATPTIADPHVFLLGAGGDLHCLDIDTGTVIWRIHLVDDLGGERPEWGYSGSPLLLGGRLIVQPGGNRHPIVALDASNGEVIWSGSAGQAAYAALQTAVWGGRRQIVGFDRTSLGGWDAADGRRLWSIQPRGTREFHVPTPVLLSNSIITAGENRGAVRYGVDLAGGIPEPRPVATAFAIAPDMHSPVAVGNRWIAVHEGLHVRDTSLSLEPLWSIDDPAFEHFASLIVTEDRLLVLNDQGELLLVNLEDQDSRGSSADDRILGREHLGDDLRGSLAHPALAGRVLYVRGNRSIQAWSLDGGTDATK